MRNRENKKRRKKAVERERRKRGGVSVAETVEKKERKNKIEE